MVDRANCYHLLAQEMQKILLWIPSLLDIGPERKAQIQVMGKAGMIMVR